MDAKTTIKAWKWFTITLAVLNIALCTVIWFRPQQGSMPRPEKPDAFIVGKLHFTEGQIATFDELKHRHHDSVVALQDEGRKMRKALFDNLKQGAKTELQTDSMMTAIGNNQKQIEFVTYRHFRQVRELCNDEQKKIFDDIIQEVMKKMGGRPPRPDGPPPGGPDGPPPPERGQDGTPETPPTRP